MGQSECSMGRQQVQVRKVEARPETESLSAALEKLAVKRRVREFEAAVRSNLCDCHRRGASNFTVRRVYFYFQNSLLQIQRSASNLHEQLDAEGKPLLSAANLEALTKLQSARAKARYA